MIDDGMTLSFGFCDGLGGCALGSRCCFTDIRCAEILREGNPPIGRVEIEIKLKLRAREPSYNVLYSLVRGVGLASGHDRRYQGRAVWILAEELGKVRTADLVCNK